MVVALSPAGTPLQKQVCCFEIESSTVVWTWEKGPECWIVSQGMKKIVYLVAQAQLFLHFLPLPRLFSLEFYNLSWTQSCPLCTWWICHLLCSLEEFFTSLLQASPDVTLSSLWKSRPKLFETPTSKSLCSSHTALLSGPLQVSLFCFLSVPQDPFTILFV